MSEKILVIHGPNLNLLGEREPGIYGDESFDSLNEKLVKLSADYGMECEIFQSNHEGAIIDKLHEARKIFKAVILNAGAYTHYSYAIRDAIAAIKIPVIEVHISDINSREEFRHISYEAPYCLDQIKGHGINGYIEAIDEIITKVH